METKELKITVPEGFEIDRENSTFEKIVFKKIDTKPRSWEEYCSNLREGFYFNLRGAKKYCCYGRQSCDDMKDLFLDQNLSNAFLAMMQLMSLRQAWIGDWKPDWNDSSNKWCIINFDNKLDTTLYTCFSRALNFPTREMTNEFLNCFKDLLEVAKPLI